MVRLGLESRLLHLTKHEYKELYNVKTSIQTTLCCEGFSRFYKVSRVTEHERKMWVFEEHI